MFYSTYTIALYRQLQIFIAYGNMSEICHTFHVVEILQQLVLQQSFPQQPLLLVSLMKLISQKMQLVMLSGKHNALNTFLCRKTSSVL